MIVEEVMDKEVFKISPTTSIADAMKLMQRKRLRNLPIIDENEQVVGIVSDRDVHAITSPFTEKKKENIDLNSEVELIMSSPVITIHPLDFIEEIAHIFYHEEFASLPVVQDRKLVGVVTEREMFYTLIQLTGTHVQSSHIEVKVPDRPGTLPEIASIFGDRRINISSLLVYPYQDDHKYKILVFRFQTMNPLYVINDIREAGYELMWPNHMEPRI